MGEAGEEEVKGGGGINMQKKRRGSKEGGKVTPTNLHTTPIWGRVMMKTKNPKRCQR